MTAREAAQMAILPFLIDAAKELRGTLDNGFAVWASMDVAKNFFARLRELEQARGTLSAETETETETEAPSERKYE